MRYALIFPGQGAQRPGMGREFYDNYQSAKSVFEEADDALGFSLSDIIFNGTPEQLAQTTITQPAILTVSVAAYKALGEELGMELTPCCVAGHSLGEYTSLVAMGTLSLTDGVRLVNLRGGLMQEAVPFGAGQMAAVVGMTLDEVCEVCGEAAQGQICQAANVNSPTQVVISGHTEAVERAVRIIEGKGCYKVVPLRVSAPFHCELMRLVADKLKEAFKEIKWAEPKCPIVANASARALTKVDDIKEALFIQTFSPVLWSQSVLTIEGIGTDGYIELGPGSVLSGLVRKICNGKRPYPVADAAGLLAAANFLRGETK